VIVVGLSHKNAPVEVRERFAAGKDQEVQLLDALKNAGPVGECVFLSTCNRVEVLVAPKPDASPKEVSAAVREVLRRHSGAASAAELDGWLYERRGDDAVRHLFRVAASLDSMVVGEPQILGQVKDAFETAVRHGTVRGPLERCVSRAFSVAKRIRTETALGVGTVSISSVAVDLARGIFGSLDASTVLLVGAGEMAEAACRSLGKDAKSIRVTNRSFERAATLAREFGGVASTLDALEAELSLADVVVTSTGATNYIVTAELVRRVMKTRRGRTLFFVDISVPRNVDPEVHGIDNVYVFDVDDLEAQVKEGMRARSQEVIRAEAIVDEELAAFRAWQRSADVKPVVLALRAKVKGALAAELDRSLAGKLKHLGDAEKAALFQLIEGATNRICHAPTTRLKDAASAGDADALVASVVELFELNEPATTVEPAAGERPARLH
jgi:glutamyl-tRNA reductase